MSKEATMEVLIIEDDPLHRSYLHDAVRAALPECDTVLEAENGRIGEGLARQHRAAHIVMDLQMSERNGIEAARTIWKERPDTRILFWSNYADEAYVRGVSHQLQRAGAGGSRTQRVAWPQVKRKVPQQTPRHKISDHVGWIRRTSGDVRPLRPGSRSAGRCGSEC